MFSARCFKENCQNKLYAKCDCEERVLFCQEHGYEHLLKPSSSRHQPMQIYFKPAEEIKQPIIEKLTKLTKEIKIYKREATDNTSKLMKHLNGIFAKYLDKINEIDKKCSKMIERLLSGEEFLDIASEDDMESVLKLDAQVVNIKIARWNIDCCSSIDYKKIDTVISKTYEIPFNPFMPYLKEEVESSELSFFRHNTSNFSTINLDSFQVSSTITFETQEKIDADASKCILPDKTYFYCCNPGTNSGLAFMIGKNRNVTQLQKSKINKYLDPIFYNNFIYLLRGQDRLAERYDLKKNVWESMAPLPAQDVSCGYISNALFEDLILWTGCCYPKVISYNITQNNYEDVPNLVLYTGCSKFMLRGNNRIYLFERGKRIFESAKNDISNWENIGSNTIPGNYLHQSVVVRYKGSLYFVEKDSQLWKFDLSSKQLSHIANI